MMIKAAIASTNSASAAQLRASLQQSGLVESVVEWNPSPKGEWNVRAKEDVPEVVILDIDRDPSAFFLLSLHVRRLRPTVNVIATSAHEPWPELLREAMRSGVREFLPSPLDANTLRSTVLQFIQESSGTGVILSRKLIVVMGAKGGVGTSTLAINLAAQIASTKRKRTILMDLGQPVGHGSLMLDLRPRFTIRDGLNNLSALDAHFLNGLLTKHSSGLELLAGIAHPEDWGKVSSSGVARIVNVARTIGEVVVMDFGVSFAPQWRDVLSEANKILVVAEPTVPSLWSLERYLSAMADLDRETDRIQIVINRWTRKDETTVNSLEKHLKRSVLARLPNDTAQVSEAINLGVPLFKNHRNPLLTQIRELATQLVNGGPPKAVVQPPRNGFGQFWAFAKER
jgi:pilus assembly protein CpaE